MAIKYIKYIDKFYLREKRVLIRVDFNVPINLFMTALLLFVID